MHCQDIVPRKNSVTYVFSTVLQVYQNFLGGYFSQYNRDTSVAVPFLLFLIFKVTGCCYGAG